MRNALRHVARVADRDLWFGRVESAADLSVPFGGAAFLVLLFVADPSITDMVCNEIASALVQSGCRYAVCAGAGCDAWHDAVDLAALGSDPPRTAKDVMTTWHANESVDDVVEFFLRTAYFEPFQPNYLVVQVGLNPQLEADVREKVKAEFLGR